MKNYDDDNFDDFVADYTNSICSGENFGARFHLLRISSEGWCE
jgi:hypothetical protein